MNQLTYQNWDVYPLQDNDGYLNTTNYQTQDSAQNKRKQLQSQHSQVRDFLNTTVKNAVDNLEAQTFVSDDANLTITKVGTVNRFKINVSPSGEATKAYVDQQDTATYNQGKTYTETYTTNSLATFKTNTLDGLTILRITRSAYDALATKDANTQYEIDEDN